MNRSAQWLLGLALLPLAACASSTPPAPAPVAPPPLAAADQTFLNAAMAGTTADQQVNQLGAAKARSPRIKAFASSEADADASSLQQLQTIAQSKGVTPDTTTPQPMQDLMAKLNAAKPAAFDRTYLQGETAVLKAGITTFQDEIANGQDADLKAYATSTLPVAQKSLQTAQGLTGGGTAHTGKRHSAK